MDIVLGYIEGISYIDTPYFASINAQTNYFDNHALKVIGSTFYPPHYRNSIRIDTDDIDFDSQVNYLWFEYSGKRYYYFINSISYINETIIEFEVILDVIQTFMFNIYISNGVIERRHINRWVNNKINRNYLRENVSEGLFTEQVTTLIDRNTWLIVKATELNGFPINSIVNDPYVLQVPYGFYCIPVGCKYVTYTKIDSSLNVVRVQNEEVNFTDIRDVLSRPEVIDAYIIYGNPYPDIFTVDTYNGNIRLTVSDDYRSRENMINIFADFKGVFMINHLFLPYEHVSYNNGTLTGVLQYINQNKLSSSTDINYLPQWTPVNAIGSNFNPDKITQLVDENYIRIEFGDGGGVTTYPLFNSDEPLFSYVTYMNIDEGSFVYAIEYDNDTLYTGLNYESYCLSNMKLSLPLINDAWSQYKAANQGRWAAAGIGSVKNAISSFTGIMSKNAYINKRISSLLSDPNRFDKRYKNSKLKDSYSRKIFDLSNSKKSPVSDVSDGLFDSISPLMSQAAVDYNAIMTPDSIRQAGDAFGAFISTQGVVRSRILRVNDYNQCANYYHRNGYKVNEYISNVSDIFSSMNNRYYFNILKMGECDVHLHNYIENEENIEEIRDRLIDGIRLWNVHNRDKIGDFTYDNVENAYL